MLSECYCTHLSHVHYVFCSRQGHSPTPIRISPGSQHHDMRLIDTVSNVVDIVKHEHAHGYGHSRNRRRNIGEHSPLTELYFIRGCEMFPCESQISKLATAMILSHTLLLTLLTDSCRNLERFPAKTMTKSYDLQHKTDHQLLVS
jgi:hypothetical protein